VQVTEPGKMANWIARAEEGHQGPPVEFEYVRL
jgi:hypothetical protein